MVQVMQQMKPADYYSWLKRLGLGQIAGIDLPSEARSQMKSQKQFINSQLNQPRLPLDRDFLSLLSNWCNCTAL
jgi:cell division protein FtsI (penicillin-binding protein 3)